MKFKSLLSLFTLLLSLSSEAKLIQIIHTNDLHSHFDGIRGGKGGYARVKTVVDSLRAEAMNKGIPSIYLDGGDFGEGSTFYFSNKGRDALKALDLLGVDASVLGNHDYILGGQELASQIKDVDLQTPLLSANVKNKHRMGLENLLLDYKDFDMDGLKVRVVGLTTPDLHFQYPLRPDGKISSPHNAGIRAAKKFAKSDMDFLIALSHTGAIVDKKLIRKSKNIGLVVGGHDHLRFLTPVMEKNKNGIEIPILQAGSNSMAVGSLLIDVQDRQGQIVDYKFINIDAEIEKDPVLEAFTTQADANRNAYFDNRWDEVIGFSKIDLTGEYEGLMRNRKSCWSRHIAKLTRESVGATLGFQLDVFQGQEIPAGPITYGDVIENFPHFRSWGDKGWTITKGKLNGFLLQILLKSLKNIGPEIEVTIDGLKAEVGSGKMKRLVNFDARIHSSDQARVDGKKLTALKFYSIALPSEVIYGMNQISSFVTGLILKDDVNVPETSYWPLLEEYIKKNSPLDCLQD